MPSRLGIVVPPTLDIMDLEARLLEKRDGVADIVQLAAGKDIAQQDALLGQNCPFDSPRNDLA